MIDLFGGEIAEKKRKIRTIRDTVREAKKSRLCISCIHWTQEQNPTYGLCKVHEYGKYSSGIIYKYNTVCKEKGFRVGDFKIVKKSLDRLDTFVKQNGIEG